MDTTSSCARLTADRAWAGSQPSLVMLAALHRPHGCISRERAERLAREFAIIDVDPDPISVHSFGTSVASHRAPAGIDFAMSLVEDNHGTHIA